MSKVLSMSIDNADIAMLTFAMNSAISERKNNASPDAVKAYKDLWRRIQEGIKEDEDATSEPKPNIETGEIVVYKGGLFRVLGIAWQYGLGGQKNYFVQIGETVAPISEVRKADFRDEVRILKGGNDENN